MSRRRDLARVIGIGFGPPPFDRLVPRRVAGRIESTSEYLVYGAPEAPRAAMSSPDSSALLGRGAILKRADRLAATSAHPSRSRRIQPSYRGGELPCGAHGRTLPGDAVPKPSGGLAAAPPTAPKRFRRPSGPSSSSGNEENSTGGISGDQFFAMPCRARQPCPRMGERFPFAPGIRAQMHQALCGELLTWRLHSRERLGQGAAHGFSISRRGVVSVAWVSRVHSTRDLRQGRWREHHAGGHVASPRKGQSCADVYRRSAGLGLLRLLSSLRRFRLVAGVSKI